MASITLLILILISTFFANALVLMCAARWVRSEHGTFRNGLMITVLMSFVNIGLLILVSAVQHLRSPAIVIPTVLLALVIQVGVPFFLIRSVFQLTVKKAFIPFGAGFALAVVVVLLTGFIIKPYVFEAFVLPTYGMSPTVKVGDRFLVNHVITARRWDIVAYANARFKGTIYCHRLVGLPGDRLRFNNGEVYVNDQAVVAPSVVAGKYHASIAPPLTDGMRYKDGETIQLGEDEIFIIGDNVNSSLDSRAFGPIKKNAIYGVVDVIYWPVNSFRIIR